MRFGDYDVLGRIAIGGMGEVYRARRRTTGLPVALKLIRSDFLSDERFLRMFVAEAEVGALLDHQNIVRLIEFGEIEGVPFIAQEYVDGVSLDRMLVGGPLPPAVAAYVALALCGALGYAHALTVRGAPLKLVHRDVSPQNVLVSRAGAVKLTDFGVVKMRGVSLTDVGEVKGKRSCMAPEQLLAGGAVAHVDLRCDLFALGVLLYTMTHGRGPFDDVEHWLRAGARVSDDGPLGAVIARALAVDPERRFPSAAAFGRAVVEAVMPALDGANILAARVRKVSAAPRPLARLESLLLAELSADSDSVPIAHAFDEAAQTSPEVQWTMRLAAPAVVAPAHDETQTNPIETLTSSEIMVDATSGPLPPLVPMTPMPSSRASSEPPTSLYAPAALETARFARLRERERIVLGAIAGVSLAIIAVGAWWLMRKPPALRELEPMAAAAPVSPLPLPAPPTERVRPEPQPEPEPEPERVAAPPRRRPTEVVRVARARAAKPPPAAPSAATAQPGLLTLDTEPWATAYVGGRKLGTTPIVRASLPAGRHVIVFDVEDSGRKKSVPVIVPAGAEQRLSLHLAP